MSSSRHPVVAPLVYPFQASIAGVIILIVSVATVLCDLAERFPDSPHALPAQLLCAHVALEQTNQAELALRLIAGLERNEKLRQDARVTALHALAGP